MAQDVEKTSEGRDASEAERCRIYNQTAHSLGLQKKNHPDVVKRILPPFGESVLSKEQLEDLEYEGGKSLGLIRLEPLGDQGQDLAIFLVVFLLVLFFGCVLWPLWRLIDTQGHTLQYWVVVAVIATLLSSLVTMLRTTRDAKRRRARPWELAQLRWYWQVAGRWLRHTASMLVVLTIAFGFPAVVILAYGGLPVNQAEPVVRAVTGSERKATQGNPKQQPKEPNTTPSSANGTVGNTRSDKSGEDSQRCLERSGKYVRAVFAGVRWNDLHVFARVLQWLFIGTFASLPALLFYLFDRQRLSTLRSTFFRSVLSIHPCLATYGDAQSVYGARVDEAFGDVPRDIFESSGLDMEAKTYQPRTGRLRGAKRLIVVVATLVITIGWMLCLSPVGRPLDGTSNEIAVLEYFVPAPAPIVFAFLGAYVFSIGSLFRLYVCSDLRPKAYAHVCVRVVTAIALGWAISVIPVSCESLGKDRQTMESNRDPNRAVSTQGTAQQSTTQSRNDANAPSGGPSEGPFQSWNSTDLGGYASLLLAFTIGAFPSLGFAIIREFLRSRYRIRTWVPPYKEQLPLHHLDGINMYQRARLLDEGIENIENLAHADLVELLLQTRFPVPTLVDWTDQAILHLHIRSMPPSLPAPSPQHADKANKGANDKQRATEAQDDSEYYLRDVRILQSYGIRTATDLLRAYDRSKQEEPHKTQFLSVLGPAESEPKRLRLVLDAIEDDEWMPHLRYHRSLKRFSHRLLTLEDAEKRMIEHGVLDIECHDWVSP